MQVGVGRAGFYSYDLLDNLGRPSAIELLPRWQDLEVGDCVAPMTNPPTTNTSFVVQSMTANRNVVWSKADSTWAWTLTSLAGERTRLVTRLKQHYRPRPAAALTIVLSELGDFVMMRKMLRGIKYRAEHLSNSAGRDTNLIAATTTTGTSSGRAAGRVFAFSAGASWSRNRR